MQIPIPIPLQSESAAQGMQLFDGPQMGFVEEPTQSAFVRQPTHIPASGPASPGTQTGVATSFAAHALEFAQAWHVCVDRLQMGLDDMALQSVFARQPTHIPAFEPASPGTQTGVPALRLPQAAVFAALQLRQVPPSISQMGVVPLH
jgi:hypothetical protein